MNNRRDIIENIDDENTLFTTHLQSAPVIPKSGPQVHNVQVVDSPEQVRIIM